MGLGNGNFFLRSWFGYLLLPGGGINALSIEQSVQFLPPCLPFSEHVHPGATLAILFRSCSFPLSVAIVRILYPYLQDYPPNRRLTAFFSCFGLIPRVGGPVFSAL